MTPLLYLFTRWAAYQQMTPAQQALEDADRFLPTSETIRLLAWWHANPIDVCPTCGREFEQPNWTGDLRYLRAYCSKRCLRRADYLRRLTRLGRVPRYRSRCST